jgi:hypothetical protein
MEVVTVCLWTNNELSYQPGKPSLLNINILRLRLSRGWKYLRVTLIQHCSIIEGMHP